MTSPVEPGQREMRGRRAPYAGAAGGRAAPQGIGHRTRPLTTVAKIIEVRAESKERFEHAIREGIATAVKSVHDINGAWIRNQQVTVENGKVTS